MLLFFLLFFVRIVGVVSVGCGGGWWFVVVVIFCSYCWCCECWLL